ncbi:hypothetical protein CJJ23_03095 [Mycoplasmopsis agassizii]|uniref:Uncharacterized protein n=2 Tax=Mycoplasmopsis agassizii TaxID=33922 RepID=A0A269TIL9_9BACT|nr:hypothetical protein CJJ23_03095 [Mycoplasmopsis agassizii]
MEEQFKTDYSDQVGAFSFTIWGPYTTEINSANTGENVKGITIDAIAKIKEKYNFAKNKLNLFLKKYEDKILIPSKFMEKFDEFTIFMKNLNYSLTNEEANANYGKYQVIDSEFSEMTEQIRYKR